MSSPYSEVYGNLIGTANASFPRMRKRNIYEEDNLKKEEKSDINYGNEEVFPIHYPEKDDYSFYCAEEDECVIPGVKLREEKKEDDFEHVKKIWNQRKDLLEVKKPKKYFTTNRSFNRKPLIIRTKKKSFFDRFFGKISSFFTDIVFWLLIVFGCLKEDYSSKSEYYQPGEINPYEDDIKQRKISNNSSRADFLLEKKKMNLKKIAGRMRTKILRQELQLYSGVQDHSKRDILKNELKKRGKLE